jgi:hypothetical protein
VTFPSRPLPACLPALTEAEFGPGSVALRLLELSLQQPEYDHDSALSFLSAARGVSAESWSERCLAVLLLENQLLRLAPGNLDEFDILLVRLGLKPEPGLRIPVNASVQKEGYSTQSLSGFVPELIRRLSRLNRVHQAIRQANSDADADRVAWEYVLRNARDVSKLTLARYLFSPEEVTAEIVRHLALSKAVPRSAHPLEVEAPDAPDFEAAILQRLCADRRIYWVSERCGSELNALVEFPLTSAVVVIKPPGSDFEFEIKRAGTRGPRLLNVIGERNGIEAPVSHRLFGGSLGWLAQRETDSAWLFSKTYRLVHGTEGPCSRTVLNSTIVSVPTAEGDMHILDYLTGEQRFGPGFEDMRAALKLCVKSFPSDTGVRRASYAGEDGTTLQFIGQALPEQAIIYDSSSFRLDRIALYLSDAGADEYFRVGLGCGYTIRDALWLADTVLEEILGEVAIPREGYMDYAQYVRDAFSVPENRARADANYLSVMRQLGECWGTLLAVRGFSDGESFVQRNVGLKSTWRNGEWRIRIIFMDHDDLTVAGSRYQYSWLSREVPGMQRDQIHILGGTFGHNDIRPGAVGALRDIFRIGDDAAKAGLMSLQEALSAAYRKTQSQLGNNPELQDLFYPKFIEGHRDFDELAASFLESDPSEPETWKAQAAAFLKARDYGDDRSAEYTEAICHYRPFFERMSFLYAR